MTSDNELASSIETLVAQFLPLCADGTTLSELQAMVNSPSQWHEAHALFTRIRLKNLAAARSGNQVLEAQYCFEEVCAKTLYNLSESPAPF